MWLLKTFAPWLLLTFLGQQVSLSSCARNKSRGADKTVTSVKSGNKPAASGRGKFSIEDKMQCTWGAKDVGDAVRLSVKCEDQEARAKGGVTDLECHYDAKPQSCPGYQSDTKGFWKQVARAFKRLQGKVCRDERALVKAGMCKRAPRDAHFKLDVWSAVASGQSGGSAGAGAGALTSAATTAASVAPRAASVAPRAASVATRAASVATTVASVAPTATNCTGRANHRRTAEETCSSTWVSLCNFFLSMLQRDDC